MKTKLTAMLLVCALILGALAVPAGLAEERYTASTPLADASQSNIKNIERAAASINGTRVESGERFSFNETVGPRTKAQGYVPAENARGVSVTGGGVAQVATTLYLALLRIGDQVEFTQLSTYGQRFEDTYVSDGSKAVITDYSGGTDFEFVNHAAGAMTIELWTSQSALNCVVTVSDGKSGGDWFTSWNNDGAKNDSAPTDAPAPQPTSTPVFTNTISASIPWTGDDGTYSNVVMAAKSINGTRLNTDDVFSFNEIVGPRTKKNGYVSGTNGRGVSVTGGGVAQVASAVWLAVKQLDDVSIIEKSTYGKRYNQKYVESSADAIVTDYKSKKDFSFRYKGSGSIVIYTSVVGDYINCDISFE